MSTTARTPTLDHVITDAMSLAVSLRRIARGDIPPSLSVPADLDRAAELLVFLAGAMSVAVTVQDAGERGTA
jgi:hypothetical protein